MLSHDTQGPSNPKELKTLITQSLDADKALDIITVDLHDNMGIADYMIIASGTSSRHVRALADRLKDKLSAKGVKNIRLEGIARSDWIVMDAGDIIIHIFRPETREFYNMEKMWCAYQPYEVVSGHIPA